MYVNPIHLCLWSISIGMCISNSRSTVWQMNCSEMRILFYWTISPDEWRRQSAKYLQIDRTTPNGRCRGGELDWPTNEGSTVESVACCRLLNLQPLILYSSLFVNTNYWNLIFVGAKELPSQRLLRNCIMSFILVSACILLFISLQCLHSINNFMQKAFNSIKYSTSRMDTRFFAGILVCWFRRIPSTYLLWCRHNVRPQVLQ